MKQKVNQPDKQDGSAGGSACRGGRRDTAPENDLESSQACCDVHKLNCTNTQDGNNSIKKCQQANPLPPNSFLNESFKERPEDSLILFSLTPPWDAWDMATGVLLCGLLLGKGKDRQ